MQYSSYHYLNPTSQRILEEFEHRYASTFKRAYGRWNHQGREFMREEIRVRLQKSDSKLYGSRSTPIQVPIKLLPDQNGVFLQLVDNFYPQLDFLEFVRMRAFLDASHDAQQDFQRPDAPTVAFKEAQAYAHEVAGRFQLDEVMRTLFSQLYLTGSDVFGSYSLTTHQIELYYVPMLIFSTLSQVDAGAFYAIVLAHELAHAYTHVGRDIDGHYWEEFEYADPYVAEGLAQYYTERFAQHFPELLPTYNTLLAWQSGPYLAHCHWPEHYDKETVRSTLIETRRLQRPSSLSDFEAHMARIKRRATSAL